MKIIKCNLLHRIGNVIQSLIIIMENIVIVITLGFIYPNWSMKWVLFRLNTRMYQQDQSNFINKSTDIEDRKIAMKWWNSLSIDSQVAWTESYYPERKRSSLTGREIEYIFMCDEISKDTTNK